MYPYVCFVLPSYAVMAFVGGFLAVLFLYFRLKDFTVEFSDFMKLFLICGVSAFVGARVLFVLTQLTELFQAFSLHALTALVLQGGLVYYGGLFGVLTGMRFYAMKTKKYKLIDLYNLVAPAIPLFHGFGRVGCFMSGCCYGRQLKNTWNLGSYIQFSRIPTQLIEAAFEFLLFAVLLFMGKKSNHLLRIYLISYGSFRFAIEFYRGDAIRGIYGGLSTAQWISIIVLLYYGWSFMGTAGMLKSQKKKVKSAQGQGSFDT